MKKPTVLIAEEDATLRRNWKSHLVRQGYEVLESSDKIGTLQTFETRILDLVILGSLHNESRTALAVAQQIRQSNKRIPLIFVVVHSSENLAIAALTAGVNGYLKPPFSDQELAATVVRCLADCVPQEGSAKGTMTSSELVEGRMIGRSRFMQETTAYITQIASTNTSVLITGETGTGKELVADLIHRSSPRCHKPFVCINCAAIPDTLLESELFGHERGSYTGAHNRYEGKLKLADGGTVFLDEIGDLSSYAQAKILRVIESKEAQRIGARGTVSLNIRLITATNQDLDLLASEAKFRKDLYFRLNVARIHLFPLRDRKEDIPDLLAHYIREFNRQFGCEVKGLTAEALEFLTNYDWPGNVRELKNLLEVAFAGLVSHRISLLGLPKQFREMIGNRSRPASAEVQHLLSALSSTNWNKSEAARRLNWSRMTVYRKIAKYHIASAGNSG